MRKFVALFGLLLLSGCLTINVYFPAAEAQSAAKEIVDKVIGNSAAEEAPPVIDKSEPRAQRIYRFDPIGFFIGTAHAQETANINIRTPAIQDIQNRMADRFSTHLVALFDSGALGFGKNGLIVVKDATKIPLKNRVATNGHVADDNRDRDALYREIAVANDHPEWEEQIRSTFAKQWVASARAGWWYETSDGSWKQK